ILRLRSGGEALCTDLGWSVLATGFDGLTGIEREASSVICRNRSRSSSNASSYFASNASYRFSTSATAISTWRSTSELIVRCSSCCVRALDRRRTSASSSKMRFRSSFGSVALALSITDASFVLTSARSTVDLAEVRTKLASVNERAKATDPNELRKRILELEADVRRLSSARTQQLDQRTINSEVERQVEIAVAEVEKRYEALEAKYEEALDELRDRLRQITELASLSIPVKPSKPVARTLQPRSVQSASPPDLSRRIQSPPPQSNVAGEKLPPGEKATLIAAAQYPEGVTREQCSILTGYKRSSRDAYIARLSGKGYVDARGPLVFVTESGIDALGSD